MQMDAGGMDEERRVVVATPFSEALISVQRRRRRPERGKCHDWIEQKERRDKKIV